MLKRPVSKKPLDHQYQDILQKLKIGKSLVLTDDTTQQKAWYRAARRLGIKVSIRSMPDGLRLWRVT